MSEQSKPYGVVDRLGYLYCADCAQRLEKHGEGVYALPHSVEKCESCGRRLDAPIPKPSHAVRLRELYEVGSYHPFNDPYQ